MKKLLLKAVDCIMLILYNPVLSAWKNKKPLLISAVKRKERIFNCGLYFIGKFEHVRRLADNQNMVVRVENIIRARQDF